MPRRRTLPKAISRNSSVEHSQSSFDHGQREDHQSITPKSVSFPSVWLQTHSCMACMAMTRWSRIFTPSQSFHLPGSGSVTTAGPAAWMREPDSIGGRLAAALIGVAPFAHDSGTTSAADAART